jgi:hypothetical protein
MRSRQEPGSARRFSCCDASSSLRSAFARVVNVTIEPSRGNPEFALVEHERFNALRVMRNAEQGV